MQQHFYALRNSFAAILVLVLVSTASILRGQTLYIGANNGDWATATNWNNGLPSSSNPPTVTGGAVVNINGTLTIDYVIQNFGTIINLGTTTVSTGSISSGGALENQGTLTVSAAGSITSSGGMLNSGTFNNLGNVNSNSAWTNAPTGVLNNSATFMQLAPMTNDGTITNLAGLFSSPQAITNNKIIDNKLGARWVIDFGGSFQNLVGSALTNAGTVQNLGTFTNNTTVTNFGVFNNNSTHICTGIFNNESGGLLESTATLNLSGLMNNKIGASVRTSFRFNILALGYVANFASFTNNDQVSIALAGTFSNEIGATMPLGAGSKVLNAGYLKFALNSSTSGSGEINNSSVFDNHGSVISAGGGKVINSGTLNNFGLIKDANILDNSGTWKNEGTIENNNGAMWTNTGTVENRISGKIINKYDIFNKPNATFTNNGTFTNNVRFTNEAGFTNNAYVLNIGDFLNKLSSTFTNNEVIENREGAIVNEGTLTNTKTIYNSNCAVFSNRAALSNTGRIENTGLVFQKGSLIGNAIVAITGWVQNSTTSDAAICRTSLQAGTDVVGEAKVYGQNPLLANLGIDECANFQYAVDNTTRAVYSCSKVGQTFSVPFKLLTRTNDSLTCTVPITVFDGVPPVVANCPTNITILTDQNTATHSWATITATDNCSPTVNIVSTKASGSVFELGTTEVIITASDTYGNNGDCRFKVTVQKIVATGTCTAADTTPPVFTDCPANISVDAPNGGLVVAWTPPSVSDACLPIVLTANAAPGQFYTAGGYPVIYTAKDAKGNTSTCAFTITVIGGGADPCLTDTIKPTINCPTNIFATTNSTIVGAVGIWRSPSVTDNCGFVNLTSTANSGTIFPVGATNVTYTATDAKNNTATCTFVIVVAATSPCTDDVTAPTLVCPENVVVNTTTATATATWTVPTPTDACGVTLNGTRTPNSTFELDSTFVTYTATDNVGNRSTCTFAVVVKNACFSDTTRPTVTGCPANITVNDTGAATTGVATWTAPVATDNCSTPTVVSNFNSGQSFPLGTTTVTYTATDLKGLTATCSFTVTYTNACTNDSIPPSFGLTCPSNRTTTSSNGACVIYGFNAPTATDNCGTPSVTSTYVNGFCFPIGVTPITYTATDAKNNKATCTFTVTVTIAITNTCANSASTGGITREFFQLTATVPTSPVLVPTTAPTTTSILARFEAPQNVADSYIQRVRGFLRPTVSGNYTFYVTGDANSDLYLSTSTTPAAKTRIAFLSGFTKNNELTKYPSQKSAIVALVAGQNYYIEGVQQENSGSDNLAVYWVVPNTTTPVIIPGANLVPFCQNSTVCATPTNLALNKTATQSSNYLLLQGAASKAVDGNTNGNYNSGSVTHTACGTQDWWQVDLGVVANITQVKLWNRTDCCADRLKNVYLIVSNTPFATNSLTTLRNTAGVFVINIASVALNATIDVNRTGRYVRVQLGASGCLSLAEVQVFGCAATPVINNPCSIAGSVVYERWNNYVNTVRSLPVRVPTTTPSIAQTQGNTQGFWNIGDNYMTRVRGYIKPTTTGVYSFNVTGDDNTELYLSPSSSPTAMTRIASITGWTLQNDYTKFSSQTSANITLTAGQLYYFEMRQVEAGGGDGWNIFWKTPTNTTWQIIQAQNLARPCVNNVFAATSKEVFTFEARADVNQAKLQWVSNGGDKNDYYEVEHLNEAGKFETIGTINAATATTEAESFSFTDANPLDGDNSYRIKTVENAGNIKLSDIKTVTFVKTDGVRLFPNPANDYVDIDLKKYDGLQVTITLYNQFGKIVQTAHIEKASSAPFHLEFGEVTTGMYLMRVQAQGKREVMRKLQITK
ncbi:MAG: HYR domain-containing protein [Saprospiraceae bacterium]|nr:HYR domain-containing protein [Saprospiraceae bacterium]